MHFWKLKNQCEDKNLVYGEIDNIADLKDNLVQNAIPVDVFDMDIDNYKEFFLRKGYLWLIR